MHTKIDHFVIGASCISDGVDYVKEILGVDIPYGGEHEQMGTHNHLMKLGDAVFLEVIAINEKMIPPAQPRWYGLDDPYTRLCIEKKPSLLTWVVNTPSIDGLMQQASFSLGRSELITRGNLSWNFGLPEDGRLLAGGLLPYAIEWHSDSHPSQNMAELGCKFIGLVINHPHADWLKRSLESIGALQLVTVNELPANKTPYLSVSIETPYGVVQLQSCSAF